MASFPIGKIFMLLLFYFVFDFTNISWVFVSCSSPPSAENPQLTGDCKLDVDSGVSTLLYHQQEAQIDKLEQLVKNLTELVARLESNYEASRTENLWRTEDFPRVDGFSFKESSLGRKEVEIEGNLSDEVRAGGRSNTPSSETKHNMFWSEQFGFVSAVKLGSVAMDMIVLPFRDSEGHSKYVAIGDDRGRVYVFFRNGDVLIEFYSSSESPISVMISYSSVYNRNETLIITGHSNGAILVHRIWESSAIEEPSMLHMEHLVALETVADGEAGSSISALEVHHMGRSRYFLSADKSGKIKVFKENGELYGLAVPMSRPLAFLKQRLLFFTETGAGSLDLRTMNIREVHCEGLNHSLVRNYVFDPVERMKAYGLTSAGDLIHAVILGDISNFKCRVRSWEKIDIDEPLSLQVIKGYLLVADNEKVYVYNISSQHYARSGTPRLVFSSGIEEISSSFLTNKGANEDLHKEKRVPLIASDREKLVVLGFGGGCVGMYHSNLIVTAGESTTILWAAPVVFFILFLFGAYHFFAKKKEVLTSWGPDDPFSSSSVPSGAPLGDSGSGDRAFPGMSSRNSDMMDLRSNGYLGQSTKRYGSPTRYPVGGGSSFRPNPVDSSSRPSVDPNFRATSELKFRGSNLETSGFANRRENMYMSSQVLDESS